MNWISLVFVAVLSGALGLVCAGGIAVICVEWYRVSSFEGKAGYFVILTAISGGVAAFFAGWIAASMVAERAGSGVLGGLGLACLTVLGLALIALALCRLFADLAPKLDGRALGLEIEVRCPEGFDVPANEDRGATAEVYLPGGRRLPSETLRLDEAKAVGDRLIVPVTVPLTTSAARKFLRVRFDAQNDLLFHLPLPSHPRASHREWSEWTESGWDAGRPEPAKDAKFHLRFRVRTIEPEPPDPDPAVVRARELAALMPDAPLERLLPFLFDGPTPETTAAVVQVLSERQSELASLVRSPHEAQRESALRAVSHVTTPVQELVDAVLSEGRAIADAIREFNERPSTEPNDADARAPDLRSRFNNWKSAWWTIHQRLGVDGRAPVQTIHDLAAVRASGTTLREIVINARAILDRLPKNPEETTPEA